MLIASDSPVYFALVFEEPKGDGMNRRIPPSFIEESTSTIQMVEVVLIGLTPPEIHVSDFEITPEMAGGISVCLFVMNRSPLCVCYPVHGIVGVKGLGVLGEELGRFGPQGRDGLRSVIERDGEAVSLVVIVHVTEDIVVDVAEEVHIWFDPPVVLRVLQGRVLVEKSAIPPAHLVVRDLIGILDIVLF